MNGENKHIKTDVNGDKVRRKRKVETGANVFKLPAIASADPKLKVKVARRFIKAAALCISCCFPSHSIVFKASASTSPRSLLVIYSVF